MGSQSAGEIVINLLANTASFSGGVNTAVSDLNRFKASAQGLDSVLAKLSSGMATLGLSLGGAFLARDAINKAMEAEKVYERVTSVVAATGEAAGFSAEQMREMGEIQRHNTMFSREEIASSEAILASFRKIRGPEFQSAMRASADIATVFKVDLVNASKSLGVALDDPLNGLLRLGRMGIKFTEDERAMIKGLMETGQLLKAQDYILESVAKKMGGAAEAASRNTSAGRLDQMKKEIEDVEIELGDMLIHIQAWAIEHLRPVINFFHSMGEAIKQAGEDWDAFLARNPALKQMLSDLGGINDMLVAMAAGALAFAAALKAAAIAQGLLAAGQKGMAAGSALLTGANVAAMGIGAAAAEGTTVAGAAVEGAEGATVAGAAVEGAEAGSMGGPWGALVGLAIGAVVAAGVYAAGYESPADEAHRKELSDIKAKEQSEADRLKAEAEEKAREATEANEKAIRRITAAQNDLTKIMDESTRALKDFGKSPLDTKISDALDKIAKDVQASLKEVPKDYDITRSGTEEGNKIIEENNAKIKAGYAEQDKVRANYRELERLTNLDNIEKEKNRQAESIRQSSRSPEQKMNERLKEIQDLGNRLGPEDRLSAIMKAITEGVSTQDIPHIGALDSRSGAAASQFSKNQQNQERQQLIVDLAQKQLAQQQLIVAATQQGAQATQSVADGLGGIDAWIADNPTYSIP